MEDNESQGINILPCWQVCTACEDFLCNLHPGLHVSECACPSVDWWIGHGLYPYDTTVGEFKEKHPTPQTPEEE